jgi:hydrogenase expression/formation protein HypE
VTDRGSHTSGPGPFLRDGSAFRLAAVVFDFDGTLTEPDAIDFAAIHQAIGCPREIGLLEFLAGVDDPEVRRRKEAVLSTAEMEAARRCRVNEGAEELVAFLRESGIPMAIITRNSREAIMRASENLPGIDPAAFAVVVTRDMPLNPKPFPDGVEFVACELGVGVANLLMIGDHAFDVEAGRRAGALTMFLQNDPLEPSPDGGADFVVNTLEEARRVIRFGLPLPTGKLPADLLEQTLAGIAPTDAAVLVGAGLGEDAAAIDVTEAEVLVLASDPITLALDSMARYTVLVNANDVATSGATPRWLLTTLLFPPGSSASEVAAMTRDIQEVCASCGVSLCGGHTEISDAVTRPVIVGTMAGTALRGELVDKRRMREGDRILLTKGVAIEGTGLIAREFGERLLEVGMTAAEIAEAGAFLDRIGILEEARIVRSSAGVTALHDVTEGGLATAVMELGAAGKRRLRLRLEKIPVYPQTERICAHLGLDPLGLIGSGSLLITVSAAHAAPLSAAIAAAGIEIAEIGEVLGEGEGIEALRNGAAADWPCFQRDEVSRLETPFRTKPRPPSPRWEAAEE